jgi:hypothetical protein
MRVVMKAFLAAAAAAGFWNQNPISRYEARPTSSQQINNKSRLLATNTPSMAAAKRLRKQKNCLKFASACM